MPRIRSDIVITIELREHPRLMVTFKRHVIVGVWLAVLLAAGCSPTTPSPVTADRLAGAWRVTSIRPAGEPEQVKPSNAEFTVTFNAGQLSTIVDCNGCGGTFTLGGATLTVGPTLACTRAFCQTQSFGDAYLRILSGSSTVSLSGDLLTLSSARGDIRLMR